MTKQYRVTVVIEVQADSYGGAAKLALMKHHDNYHAGASVPCHVQAIAEDGGVYDDGVMIGLADDAGAPLVLSVAWLVSGIPDDEPSDDAP